MARRLLACAVVVAIATIVGGCSSGSDQAATTGVVETEAEARIGDDAPPSSADASTAPDPSIPDSASADDADTAPAPVVEASAVPIEMSDDEFVEASCEVLRAAGFETRRAQLEAAEDRRLRDAVVDACESEVETLAAALQIRDEVASVRETGAPVSLTSVRCGSGTYSFIATNETDVPLGVHAALRITLVDEEDPYRSSDYPIVIWSLDPGQAQGITGEFNEPLDAEYGCRLSARVFVATPSGDAALPIDPGDTPQSNDPNDWFVDLLNQEVQSIGSEDIDAAALAEDVRSLQYASVRQAMAGAAPPERLPDFVTVCNGTVDQPSDDLISFVYFINYPETPGFPAEASLRHGLFRRGQDGKWRWLSSPQYFNTEELWACGTPTDAVSR